MHKSFVFFLCIVTIRLHKACEDKKEARKNVLLFRTFLPRKTRTGMENFLKRFKTNFI